MEDLLVKLEEAQAVIDEVRVAEAVSLNRNIEYERVRQALLAVIAERSIRLERYEADPA